jgi:hypothetical protein
VIAQAAKDSRPEPGWVVMDQLLAPVRCYRIRGGTGGLTWVDDGPALIEYLGL